MINILLERKELCDIANNLKVSNHALERLREFFKKDITLLQIKYLIKKAPFAWKQSNGQYSVVIDEFSYFILYKYFNNYMLVSYMRKSENKYNVIDKFILEYKGVKKKWESGQHTRTK